MKAFAYVEESKLQDFSHGTIRFVLSYSRRVSPQNFSTSDQLTFDRKLEEVVTQEHKVVSHRLPILLRSSDRFIDDTCPACPVYKMVTRVPYDEYRKAGTMPEPLVIPPLSQRV